MKTLLIFLLFLICADMPSAEFKALYISKDEAINEYEPLINAIVQVESRGDTFAFNVKEGATGAFQIRNCRIQHYNKLTGSNLTIDQMFDYELSKKVFLYFTHGREFEIIARAWAGGENGKRSATDEYWNKVKRQLK